MKLRNYQVECLDAIADAHKRGVPRVIFSLPTASGKTPILARIPDWLHKPTMLVLAHREELLMQAVDKLREANPSIVVDLERAEFAADKNSPIIVGSVPTLGRSSAKSRLHRFHPRQFSTIVIDETHHSVANTYLNILEYFKPEIVVGCTATPCRTDRKDLANIFNEVVYHRDVLDIYEEGLTADDGPYLAPVEGRTIKTGVDLSNLHIRGDFNEEELAYAVNVDGRNSTIISAIEQHAQDRKTILIFCVNRDHALTLHNQLIKRGHDATYVFGNTPDTERQKRMTDFKEGRTRIMVSVMVYAEGTDVPRIDCLVLTRPTTSYVVFSQQIGRGLRPFPGKVNCLDTQTEILTASGWRNSENIRKDDLIANWEDFNIFFEQPMSIIRRPRRVSERMFSVQTSKNSLRVTEDHNLIFRHNTGRMSQKKYRPWILAPARKTFSSFEIPVSGLADPIPQKTSLAHPAKYHSKRDLGRRISASSWSIRKREGLSVVDSKIEAATRIAYRDNLKTLPVTDLNSRQCYLIGFWLGDGCEGRGHDYTIAQSVKNKTGNLALRRVLAALKLDFTLNKHICTTSLGVSEMFTYGLPVGCVGGTKRRKGIASIRAYLQRRDYGWIWGLTQSQFRSLLEGLWQADGQHSQLVSPPERLDITGCDKILFDILQAVAICRGMSSTITKRSTEYGGLKYNRQPYQISFLRKRTRRIKHFVAESSFINEEVWCVQTKSGKIVTRRNGRVSVLCNCQILDLCDIAGKHPIKSLSDMFGVSRINFHGENIFEALRKLKKAQHAGVNIQPEDTTEDIIRRSTILEGLARRTINVETEAQLIDIFRAATPASEVIRESEFPWVKVSPEKYVLNMPDDAISELEPTELGVWQVVKKDKHSGSILDIYTLEKWKKDYPPFSWADKKIRTLHPKAWFMKQMRAKWRFDRATPALIHTLRSSFNIKILPPDLTKGAACDIIDKIMMVRSYGE